MIGWPDVHRVVFFLRCCLKPLSRQEQLELWKTNLGVTSGITSTSKITWPPEAARYDPEIDETSLVQVSVRWSEASSPIVLVSGPDAQHDPMCSRSQPDKHEMNIPTFAP
jgi:hypothetical protein